MLSVLIILLILILLALPYLPIKLPFTFYWLNFPVEKRPKNLAYVATTIMSVLLVVLLAPKVLVFADWFATLKFIRKIAGLFSNYAHYSWEVFQAIIVNVLFCIIALLMNYVTGSMLGRFQKKKEKKRKGLWAKLKEKWKQRKEARRKKKEKKEQDPEKKEEPETKQEPENLPEHLLPEPQPAVSTGKVRIMGPEPRKKTVRQQKNTSKKEKAKDDSEDNQKENRIWKKILWPFYAYDEGTWYVQPQCKKVAKHLRNFLLLTGAFYLVVFTLLLIPVFYKVQIQAPKFYEMMEFLVSRCYLYPSVSLILLLEIFWFMNGKLPEEPVADITTVTEKQRGRIVDLEEIERKLVQTYGKEYEIKSIHSAETAGQEYTRIPVDTTGDAVLENVLQFVESEKLLRNDDYLRGIQALQMGKNTLFDAPLYTAVSMYLYPYLNVRISQGERMLVICQNAEDIPNLIDNLREGFRRAQHTHRCLWTIHSRKELRSDNQTDILVATPGDFMDEGFFSETALFAKRLSIVMYPDADQVVAANNYLCVVMAQRLKEMRNGSRYSMGNVQADGDVQYLFLSTRHMLNLARSLTEYFLLKEPIHDVQAEYAYGSVRLHVWRSRGKGRILLDNSAQTVNLETSISNIAKQSGIPDVTIVTKNAIFPNQIDPTWLDAYDMFDRPVGYTVVSDDSYNLPSTIYTYSRYVGKEASVLHVISKDYMLRDYFYDNAARSLFERPLMERGMAEHALRDQTGTILLLCKLMSGMPVMEFAAKMAEYTDIQVSYQPTYPEIRKLVDACLSIAFGKAATAEQYGFSLVDRVEDGFRHVPYIQIREEGLLDHLINDTQLVTVQMSFNGARNVKVLPLFRRMLAQRYLPDQHMVIDHANYKIRSIDFENGVIYASAATSVHNVPDQYLQVREYTLRSPDDFIKCCQHYAAGGTSQLVPAITGHQRRVEGAGILQALTMVRAAGVLDIDSHTVAFYDSTGTPGRLNLMDSSVFSVKTDLHRNVGNAMYLRFAGSFSGNDRLTMTLTILLQEMMKTMFPDQHFCVSVCPILRNHNSIYEHPDDHCRRIVQMYPKLFGWDSCAENSVELLIVDDCEGGTGVLDMLYDPEAVYLSNILDMLCDYLDWLAKHPENAYLNYGAQACPPIYELSQVRNLLDPFYRPYLREHDLFQKLNPQNHCVFCGKELVMGESYLWNNQHNICVDCSEEYVPNEEETGWMLSHIRKFLNQRFGVTLNPAICVITDPKTEISELDVEANQIRLNPQLPLTAVHMELLRQVVRLWQLEHLRMTGEPEFEGQVLYVLLQYLEELQQHTTLRRFHSRALLEPDEAATGYCRLRQELQAIPSDNSFRYMLEKFRGGNVPPVVKTTPGRRTRHTDNATVPYYYANYLTGKEQELYNQFTEAIAAMEPEIDISALQMVKEEVWAVWLAVTMDHPEFHWWSHYSFNAKALLDGKKTVVSVSFTYTIDQAERQRRQEELDAIVPMYLEGITEESGDYDAAMQVFINLTRELDYDSLTLDREKRQKYRDWDKPDDLRNIYGALVKKKPVCEGYARAYQYLLQKLGMEAIMVAGDCRPDGRHAWNIINMEGNYYHMDVTWGDGSNTDPNKSRENISFGYFGLTDQDILLSRTIDSTPVAPSCTAKDCNYFVRNGLYFVCYDHKTIKQTLTEFLAGGQKERIDLRFCNASVFNAACKHLLDNGGIFEVLRSSNETAKVTYIKDDKLHILSVFFKKSTES